MDNESGNYGCDILLEFLEVAIHNVLFIRNVYPAAIFVRRKKYGVPVQMSVHPYVNEYITECLKAVRELLKKNEVKKVTLTFSDRNKIPLERFVFDILDLNRNFQMSDPYFIKGEEALRGFCLRLSMIASSLKPLPEESSFAVHVHSTEAATLSLAEDHRFQDFPWIETDVQETNIMEPTIVPLRTVDTGYLKLQMYVEESSVK